MSRLPAVPGAVAAYRPGVAPAEFLVLSQEDVVAAGGLDMDACLAMIEETLVLHHRGETVAPQKSALHWSNDIDTDEKLGRIMAMPAFVGGSIAMAGMKWIPSVPQNPARGLPRGIGVILLSDPDTGLPVCFMDGTVVSAMRTGAVSGLAARALAPPDARVFDALRRRRPGSDPARRLERMPPGLAEIRLLTRARSRLAAFVARESDRRPPLDPVLDDPREAARGSARARDGHAWRRRRSSMADWLEPGMLVLSVSSFDPSLDAIEAADLLVTDDFAHETYHPSRPLARAEAAGLATEADVVAARSDPRRRPSRPNGARERIVVSPVGLGIEDVALATAVYRPGDRAGRGAHATALGGADLDVIEGRGSGCVGSQAFSPRRRTCRSPRA